jgi:predicted amino acid dehydrogenase
MLPWIPPRTVCRVTVRSQLGSEARGVYIDCFIPPDRLEPRYDGANLQRIREAADYAIREGALIATLGGFSSILLEGKVDLLPPDCGTVFTTGNSLTVAYVVQGLAEAARLCGNSLLDLTVLVVGATGDVGSGCARYLAGRVKRLLLCARNPHRLRREWEALRRQDPGARAATDITELLPDADAIICVASLPSPSLVLSRARPGAIVCDAGYPPNTDLDSPGANSMVFSGGMGQIRAGIRLEPDLSRALTRHPFPNVAHGCLLEGMLLALEKRYEPFSRGRGHITPEKVDEIWDLAQKHGFALAPFFHGEKICSAPLGSVQKAFA